MRHGRLRWALWGVLCCILWPVIVTAQGDRQIKQVQEHLKAVGFDPVPLMAFSVRDSRRVAPHVTVVSASWLEK
jgi:hypothetical protein